MVENCWILSDSYSNLQRPTIKMSKLKAIRPVAEKEEEFLSVNPHHSSEDEDEEKHSKLLDAINKLGSKKRYKLYTNVQITYFTFILIYFSWLQAENITENRTNF